MPQYQWKCEKCEAEETTIQSISEAEVAPPTTKKSDTCKKHKWARNYSGKAPAKHYGAGWGYVKGHGYRGSDW